MSVRHTRHTSQAPHDRHDREPRQASPFWGWRIAGFSAVALAMTGPGQTVGVSVFVDPLINGLGVDRSQVSLAYMVGTLTGAVTMPLIGKWIDRRGVRRMMTAVGLGFAAALAAMSGVAGFISLMVGFAGIRMLGQGSLTLVATTSVALWFERRRGLALGVVTAVGSALMSLTPLALTGVIGVVGWRTSWLIAAGAVLAIVVPIGWFGMRDSPASVGQHVDGIPQSLDDAEAAQAASWSRPEALRTLMFWVVTGAVSATGMIGTGLAFHQISILGERGLTPTQAAANFLPQTAATIVATLTAGYLLDRVRPRYIIAASMAGLAAAMLLVQVAAPGAPAIAFGIAVGASGGVIRAEEAAVFPQYFGVRHVGAIRGLVMAINVGATALGPFALAVGFQQFGSYGPALNLLLIIPIGIGLLAMFTPVPDLALRGRIRTRMAATTS